MRLWRVGVSRPWGLGRSGFRFVMGSVWVWVIEVEAWRSKGVGLVGRRVVTGWGAWQSLRIERRMPKTVAEPDSQTITV
jgi:hypothetical protein